MGGKPISTSDMERHYQQRGYSRATSVEHIFKERGMQKEFNPAIMKLPRESCDSALSPKSRAIIFAEDQTGSMGDFILSLIRREFPRLITETYKNVAYNPHIMFMGIGDVSNHEEAPLQATQFETDLRMLDQLEKIYIEGDGGGNGSESYILAWYFAAKYTKIDCFDKRGDKGFLFTFGDEGPTPRLTKDELSKVFGGRDTFEGRYLSPTDCLEMASEMYYCYHIILHGDYYRRHSGIVIDDWRRLMGSHVCDLRDHSYLPELVTAILRMYEGYAKSNSVNVIQNLTARSVVEDALKWHEETVTITQTPSSSADIEIF